LIQRKDGKIDYKNSNESMEFKNYLSYTSKERLILRYDEMVEFILSTPTRRFESFSKILGFDEIKKNLEIIKSGLSHIKEKLRIKNYEDEIGRKEGTIFKKLGERIISKEQYVRKINEFLISLGYEEVKNFEDISNISQKLRQTDKTNIIQKKGYYEDVKDYLYDIKNKLQIAYENYVNFYNKLNEFLKIKENIIYLALSELWERGLNILKKGIFDKNECPLCFQEKSKEELIEEIKKRLSETEIIQSQKKELESIKDIFNNIFIEIRNITRNITYKDYYKDSKNLPIQNFVDYIENFLAKMKNEIEKGISTFVEIINPSEFIFPEEIFNESVNLCETQKIELSKEISADKTLEIQEKIVITHHLFEEILNLKKERKILEKISISLKNIYEELTRKQKEEIELFVKTFSVKLNEYYSYLHPGEKIKNIKLNTFETNNEAKGLTIEFDFFDITTYPPHKFLSESHLNSLGIVLFLCSVEAFNRLNKFFILDDVISSFDIEHSSRLCDLLLEKFEDYQIILLTHQKYFYEYMKNKIREKNNWVSGIIKYENDTVKFMEDK